MTSGTQEGFWRCFDRLPAEIQQQARERFRLWQKDAFIAALHFKPMLAGQVLPLSRRDLAHTREVAPA